MGVFPVLKKEELDSAQRAFWDELTLGPRGFSTGGAESTQLPELYNAWLQFPEFGQLILRLADEIRGRADLPGKWREMVILNTSILSNSRHEYEFHSVIARWEGLSDAVITAIGEGTPPPFADEAERLIFEANVQLVRTGTLTRRMREEVVGIVGLKGLMQLIALIGLYLMVSYTVNVAEIGVAKNLAIDPGKLQEFVRGGRAGAEGS